MKFYLQLPGIDPRLVEEIDIPEFTLDKEGSRVIPNMNIGDITMEIKLLPNEHKALMDWWEFQNEMVKIQSGTSQLLLPQRCASGSRIEYPKE